MKRNAICLFLLCILFSAQAQVTPGELTGTIIAYDKCNDTEFPVANAFDNNNSTYFRSCPPFGNWIGLDLGEKHIITQVAYCPRIDSDYRDRLQLGVFEGANQPDFEDAIALSIIRGYTERELTKQAIDCSRGFRYVRFVFPYAQNSVKSSYMGELKFYGYKGEGSNAKLPQLTNLPTVSIHTVNTQDITSKEDYVKGTISIVYDDGKKFFSDKLDIRGRGNNSWTHPKKPYRIKLNNSTNLMGLPAKGKNWTLINNYGDKTLMRNMLAFDFSRRLEMEYTSPAVGVDVVLNGDYKGCYQLCDHIDVRKNRVDIEEMDSDDLTGGYMIEIDAYAKDEAKHFFSNKYQIPVTIKYPDEDDITPAQEQYIAAHFNKWTDAANGSSYKNAETGFRKYMDMETFLRHFLVNEYSGNTDTYWSVRMYKYKDNDRFYFGPVWDFDLGFENDWRTYPINTKAWQTNEWICFSSGSSAAGNTKDLIKRIFSDTDVTKRLQEIYADYRDQDVISKEILTALVDSYADQLDQSQDLNFKRWPIMNQKVHENPVIHGSYEKEVENVRNYVAGRMDWLDHKLAYTPKENALDRNEAGEFFDIRTGRNTLSIHGLQGDYSLQIIDLCGRKLYDGAIHSDSFSFRMEKGIYLLVITDRAKQKDYVRKLLVP